MITKMQPVLNGSYSLSSSQPLLFIFFSLVFIYILQYPISRFFFEEPSINFSLEDWLIAYAFVIYSSIILFIFLKIGIGKKNYLNDITPIIFKRKKISLVSVLLIYALFFLWSYLMLDLRIGMTIFTDFDTLPFKLTGFLFYGRLIIQPLVLSYIASAYRYAFRKEKAIVFLLLISLGFWASLTSGSRFIAIMFSLPLLILFKGKLRIAYFILFTLILITVASLARHFYLPFFLNEEYVAYYANSVYQENMLSNIMILPVAYIFQRVMGIGEVLLALNLNSFEPNFIDSVFALVHFFVPISLDFSVPNIKSAYGLDDDAFGGYGLGLFPNYWFLFGSNLFTYSFGISFSAFLLGRCYQFLSIVFVRLGLMDQIPLVFILLFIFFLEARSYIFPIILVFGWFLCRSYTFKILNLYFLPRNESKTKRS